MNDKGLEKITEPLKLLNKDFVLLWLGQIVSSIGNSIQYIALMWWILEKFPTNESGIVMGWMFAFNVIPMAVVGPFAGVFVDRLSRKAIVILSDVIRGILILWMAWLAYKNQLGTLWIYTLSALMGLGGVCFNPALQSSIPNMVPERHLTKANSLYQTGVQFSNIIGPAIGGLLVGMLGVFFVILLNGLSFLFSAGTEIFINFRQKLNNTGEKNSFFKDMLEGLKFVYNFKMLLWAMIVLSLINFAFAPVDILIAKQIKVVYNLGALELGYVTSAFAIGMVVGAGLLALLPELKKKHNEMIIGIIISGGLLAIAGFSPNLLTFLLDVLIMGFFIAIVNVLFNTVLQKIVPDEKRGRVFGLLNASTTVLMPISFAVIGWMSAIFNNSTIFLVLGFAVSIISAFLYLVPGIKEV